MSDLKKILMSVAIAIAGALLLASGAKWPAMEGPSYFGVVLYMAGAFGISAIASKIHHR